MTEIQCFSEAYRHYQDNKLSFRLLQDQAVVMIGLCQNTYVFNGKAEEITEVDIGWLLTQPESTLYYENLLGGNTYVCETEQDLLQIFGCDFDWANEHDGNWPNVTNIAMSWDACNYLDEAYGDPQWVMFFMCWNNAGGAVYYVPKHLWNKARITEHIEKTNPTPNT